MAGLSRIQTAAALLIIIGALAAVPLLDPGFFIMNVFIMTFLFAILGHGWNIVGGYAGQISFGHAVFFGVGAYTTTILFLYYQITPFIGLWLGGLMAVLIGLVVGLITLRLHSHYFAMGTLAVALLFRTTFVRWDYVGGTSGLEFPFQQIGTLISFTFIEKLPYFYIIGGFAILTTALVYILHTSKLGLYLKAINMDETLAANAGLHVFRYKMYALGLSAFVTGIGGGLYALYLTLITPTSTMDLFRNVEPVIVTLIGGSGTVFGPILGAFIFMPVREYSRTILSGQYTGVGWVVFGLVIIFFSIYRPGGILGGSSGGSSDE
jgi:branched-chain amino acid transport system permease protein